MHPEALTGGTPGPNVAAVTCLDVAYENCSDGPWGLLLVGTQEGSAHLYGIHIIQLAIL